ncbi:nuclear pore complex protein [Parastagonospora nodorum]|nr:nuclear pore complex protein [Parastagonospora nodorum]
MSSFSFTRQSQPAPAAQSRMGALSFGGSRSRDKSPSTDPLAPLQVVAARVAQDVAAFAIKVDVWHTEGMKSARAKYGATVNLVGEFKSIAETRVKELKRAHAADNKVELGRSIRKRIQDMAEAPDANTQGSLSQSLQMPAPTSDSHGTQGSKQLDELRQWQAELATWELVQIIISQRFPEPETDPAAERQKRLAQVGGNKRYSPNSEIWDRFMLEDDRAKEKALVLRWLEQTARNDRSSIETITTELETQSGRGAHTWTSGWLDSKSRIKQAKRLEGADQPLRPDAVDIKTADRTQGLVTQLDPDGPARQKRVLEKSDEYYERALWMVCYEMLRRGLPWNEISEWAQERNEAWRGVSVGAAYEAHPKGGPNVAGPTVGYLFRRMCFYAARGARVPHEGAVYGLLSGDLKQVQTACRTWDDHLHAHYNALLLSRFDRYLISNYPNKVNASLVQKFVFQDAASHIGDWDRASRTVITLLKQEKATETEASSPFKLIQGALIAGTLDELLLKVGTSLADMLVNDERPENLMLHPDSNHTDPGPKPLDQTRTYTAEPCFKALACNPQAFQTLVHIFLLFKHGLNTLDSDEMGTWVAMDNVITAYIECLRQRGQIMSIPIYAAQLAPERAAHCLARIIPDVRNTQERIKMVGLFRQYKTDVIEVVAQSFLFAFKNSGFTHFNEKGDTIITSPIKRFKIIERTGSQDFGLWPGYRIQAEFTGCQIEPKEDAIIEVLQWYQYINNDYKQTFDHLRNALTILLLNGRLGAAEKVVSDLSVESLSLSRTEALCGYPFDINQPGAEERDEASLHEHRSTLTDDDLRNALRYDAMPNAEKHAAIVQRLRENSQPYYDLQLIVRILCLFREWRQEEEDLIKLRTDQSRQPSEAAAAKKKADMSHTKEVLESIEQVFTALVSAITTLLRDHPEAENPDTWNLKFAYIPEIVLAYLSVLQTAAFFLQRDSAVSSAVRAMEIANLVADEENEWLQEVFLKTGRMSELVDALAMVSKAMLRLNEHEPKKSTSKKRGSKGETLRIWDLNAKSRV